jgi:hypothetical protein
VRRIASLLLASTLLGGCATQVPPQAVAWKGTLPTYAPNRPTLPTSDPGYLKVETDTDLKQIGRDSYFNVRRSYDVYSEDGGLVRGDVYNQDGRFGEVPMLVAIAPGRYVVATMVGTVYRKVQVEVASNAVTEIHEDALRGASPVFDR